MPYQRDSAVLVNLVRDVLSKEPDVSAALVDLEVPVDDFVSRIMKNEEQIWRAAAKEIQTYDASEGELQQATAQLESSLPHVPALLRAARGIGPAIPGLLFIAYLFSLIWLSWKTPWTFFIGTPGGRIVLIAAVIAVAFMMAWSNLQRRLSDGIRATQAAKLNIDALGAAKKAALDAIEPALRNAGILPIVRPLISEELSSKWSTRLSYYGVGGLGEISNPELEVQVKARADVEALLRRMPGGSIGVAGPRGAGKTTLLSYVCSPRVSVPLDGDPPKKLLTVKTSAPVKYEARDFILHLYALLCSAVIGPAGVKDDQEPDAPLPLSETTTTTVRRLAQVFFIVGFLLVVLAAFITTQKIQQARVAAAAKTAGAKTAAAQSAPRATSDLLMEVLDPKPTSFALFGLALLIAAIALLFVVAAGPGNREAWWLPAVAALVPWVRLRRRADRAAEPQPPGELVRLALQKRDEIRFQYSYASGWGGALKLPIGIEGQRTATKTYSRQQRSLPEIVDAYIEFAKKVTDTHVVIIGIDELDKIDSTDDVHQFLNSIKALFNISGCFYILSVSENAIAAFERRGLPLRDVLDSTFDTMVRVDYLTLHTSVELIRKRVIGLPTPFIALCHCLSGGLPRDLIRFCRDLLSTAEEGARTDQLNDIVERLVHRDIGKKATAVETAIREIEFREINQLFPFLNRLRPQGALKVPELLDVSASLLECSTAIQALPATDDDPASERDNLADLATELATYSLFSATVLEAFGSAAIVPLLQADPTPVEDLAAARRAFSIRSSVAGRAIVAFRDRIGIATPAGPWKPQPAAQP